MARGRRLRLHRARRLDGMPLLPPLPRSMFGTRDVAVCSVIALALSATGIAHERIVAPPRPITSRVIERHALRHDVSEPLLSQHTPSSVETRSATRGRSFVLARSSKHGPASAASIEQTADGTRAA